MKFKAILLSVCCSFMTAGITAYAQTEVAHFEDYPYFGVIPKSLTKTDAPVLYTCERGDKENVYTIYDANWNPIKEFSVKLPVCQTRSVVKQREWVLVDSTIISHSPIEVEENGMLTYCPSLSAATSSAAARGYDIVRQQANGDVIFISERESEFYWEGIFGMNYPQYILVYYSNREPNEPCFEQCRVSYNVKAIGDWVVVSDDDGWYWFDESDMYYEDYDDNTFVTRSDGCCPTELVQNLFSTGGKNEYIRPIFTMKEVPDTLWEKDRDYDGEVDQFTLYYGPQVNTFEVLADGQVVKSFDIQPLYGFHRSYVFKLNGVFYLLLSDGSDTYIYRIDSNQNSISLVKSITNTRMYPNLINPGDAVTIDFGTGDTSIAGELVITDAAGHVMERRSVPAGVSNMQIGTRRLRAGTYNFTVYRAGKPVDNGKIIIR